MCERCEIGIDDDVPAMSSDEMREHLRALDMRLREFADLFGVSIGSAQRYRKGKARIPRHIAAGMRFLRLDETTGHA